MFAEMQSCVGPFHCHGTCDLTALWRMQAFWSHHSHGDCLGYAVTPNSF